MACSNSGCNSGCYNEEEDSMDKSVSRKKETVNGTSPAQSESLSHQSIYVKCKVNEVAAGGAEGCEDGRFCAECFRGSLFGKFIFVVTSNGMINPSDKVLVAFSGGASSR